MKEMDQERCHWCEWEQVTAGECMRTKPGTGYDGKTEDLGGKNCPGFEKWSVNKYASKHRRFLEEESPFKRMPFGGKCMWKYDKVTTSE